MKKKKSLTLNCICFLSIYEYLHWEMQVLHTVTVKSAKKLEAWLWNSVSNPFNLFADPSYLIMQSISAKTLTVAPLFGRIFPLLSLKASQSPRSQKKLCFLLSSPSEKNPQLTGDQGAKHHRVNTFKWPCELMLAAWVLRVDYALQMKGEGEPASLVDF